MHKNLKNIIRELKGIEITEMHFKSLLIKKEDLEKRLKQLEIEIFEKNSTIEKTAKISFKTIYLKLVGKHGLKLELYKQHYLELSLEYSDLIKTIELLEYEISLIEAKLKKLDETKQKLIIKINKYAESSLGADLVEYKKLIIEIKHHLELSKELEEAIKEGMSLNRKFNSAIQFVKLTANNVYTSVNDEVELLNNYKVDQIENYQNYIIEINHTFSKYVVEVNDVYQTLLKHKKTPESNLKNFMKHYRNNLSNDLRKAKDLKNSYKFLKRYKELILTLNRTLRSDLKSIKKYVTDLESKESKMIQNIAKKII